MASPSGGKMHPVPADVTSTRCSPGQRTSSGRLDVLFNNAGLNAPCIPIEDLTFETWSAIVNVNLTGAFLCAQAAFKLMKDQGVRDMEVMAMPVSEQTISNLSVLYARVRGAGLRPATTAFGPACLLADSKTCPLLRRHHLKSFIESRIIQ